MYQETPCGPVLNKAIDMSRFIQKSRIFATFELWLVNLATTNCSGSLISLTKSHTIVLICLNACNGLISMIFHILFCCSRNCPHDRPL